MADVEDGFASMDPTTGRHLCPRCGLVRAQRQAILSRPEEP
jgi:hypothetical protein